MVTKTDLLIPLRRQYVYNMAIQKCSTFTICVTVHTVNNVKNVSTL